MRRRERGRETGQATILIVGLTVVLAIAVAVVVDATAAYLQRQGLNTLADGAALYGADLGATGREIYTDGVPPDRLRLTEPVVRSAVGDYLRDVGAYGRFPGLQYGVRVDAARVVIELRAPIDLPLSFPGSPDRPIVAATGSAAVVPDP